VNHITFRRRRRRYLSGPEQGAGTVGASGDFPMLGALRAAVSVGTDAALVRSRIGPAVVAPAVVGGT
jgi:hypothetical protein